MRVFISWSGERSLVIAKALHEWLPRVIQAIDPWMSDSDIDKGMRWEQKIQQELEQTKFGILCLTPENLDSRWLNFEAGAIAKTVEKTYVWTYLVDLKPTDIEGPLASFNHTKAEDESDTRKLIHTINRAMESQTVNERILNDSFDVYWARLKHQLDQLPPATEKKSPRNADEMTEEILISVRALLKERSKNARLADNFILALMPLLKAAQTDNSLQLPPHLMSAIHDLEADATQSQEKLPPPLSLE